MWKTKKQFSGPIYQHILCEIGGSGENGFPLYNLIA